MWRQSISFLSSRCCMSIDSLLFWHLSCWWHSHTSTQVWQSASKLDSVQLCQPVTLCILIVLLGKHNAASKCYKSAHWQSRHAIDKAVQQEHDRWAQYQQTITVVCLWFGLGEDEQRSWVEVTNHLRFLELYNLPKIFLMAIHWILYKLQDKLNLKQVYVITVSIATVALWCANSWLQRWTGEMGIIAILPLVAFFGFGILGKVSPPRISSCSSQYREWSAQRASPDFQRANVQD